MSFLTVQPEFATDPRYSKDVALALIFPIKVNNPLQIQPNPLIALYVLNIAIFIKELHYLLFQKREIIYNNTP